MTARFPRPARLDRPRTLTAAIFDVDGVLLESPHERAWRDALPAAADRERFTTAMYQVHVAGNPRLAGALAALRALQVPNAEQLAVGYAERKQRRLEALVGQRTRAGALHQGVEVALDDLVERRSAAGCRAASSSSQSSTVLRANSAQGPLGSTSDCA